MSKRKISFELDVPEQASNDTVADFVAEAIHYYENNLLASSDVLKDCGVTLKGNVSVEAASEEDTVSPNE